MKRFLFSILALILVASTVYAAGENVINFKEQGGARWVVGGSVDVVSGGEMDVESGGSLKLAGTAITSTAAELNIMDGVTATAAELNETFLTVTMADISTASSVWVVSPHAGTVSKIYTTIEGAIITVDAVLDPQIAGTSITDGGITIAFTGSAAGTVDSSTPSAANVVTAGQAIEIATNGGSTNTVIATITLVITR